VLGYSRRRRDDLDPICEARLRHAETLPADAVVLSGRGRRAGEGALMRGAWRGPDVPIFAETTARNTAENAAEIAALARRLGADEVVVVTSSWHVRRAGVLVRAALRGSGIAVRMSSPEGRAPAWLRAREAGSFAVLPYHLLRILGALTV
jgi:uncharacterized SAM-binding protein YcdF (DUF218 family)